MDEPVRVDETQPDHRFDIYLGERNVGHLEVERIGDVALFTHTFIEPPFREQGLGEELVGAALDTMRRRGLRVAPHCWFVRDYIEVHPEYRELVA